MPAAAEINFDGLVGPSHNYAGLSLGNLASARNRGATSRPKRAALQGLAKMRLLRSLGLVQGVLLPQPRPALRTLRALGFSGRPEAMIEACFKADPALLANLYSASAMWAANAATVSPSADTQDARLHFTPANLRTNAHRALEAAFTTAQLRLIFKNARHFVVHDPLPALAGFGDEGAANHGRLCAEHAAAGVEVFVYGDQPGGAFPARQDLAASEAVIRRHGILPGRSILVRQSNAAIAAGAFHNDVVSVINERVLFAHQDSFEDQPAVTEALRRAFPELIVVEAPREAVNLADAIESYLFNSQLVSLPDGEMALIAPSETLENPRTAAFLQDLTAGAGPIRRIEAIDVRESMRNGGGPACLRLRVAATTAEQAAIDRRFVVNDALLERLEAAIERTYPEEIPLDGLADPQLFDQCMRAWEAVVRAVGARELLKLAD